MAELVDAPDLGSGSLWSGGSIPFARTNLIHISEYIMNVTEVLAKDLNREIKVKVPKNDIEDKLISKLEDLKKTIQLKGFRPGKVPITHLKRVFSDRVMPEVVEDIIKETSQKVIIDRNEKAAIQPKITFYEGKPSKEKEKEEIDKVIKLEKELSYKMTYEIMPEITLPKYESISVVKKIAEVTTEDIDESLLKISEENKSFTEKNDKEKAEVGDQVTIDFIGKIDGEVFEGGSANDAPLILGSGSFIPGFEDQLQGASKDKDLDIKVKFPDDYQVEQLAGKDAIFETKVKKIEKPTKTKIDNEFAKRLGFDDLKKLKDQINEQLEKDYESISRSNTKRNLLDKLDPLLKYNVPPTMVKDEFDNIWANYTKEITDSGQKIEDVIKDEKKTQKEYHGIAERRVRIGLFFNKVAEDESINVSDDEVNKSLFEQARKYPGQESEIIKLYQNNPNAMMQIKSPLIEEKVVDHIFKLIKIKEEKVTRVQLLGLDQDHDNDHEHKSKPKKVVKKSKTNDIKKSVKKTKPVKSKK